MINYDKQDCITKGKLWFIEDIDFGRNWSFQRFIVYYRLKLFCSILNNNHKSNRFDKYPFQSPLFARIQFESCQFLYIVSTSKKKNPNLAENSSLPSYVPQTINNARMWLDERFYFLDTSPKHSKLNSLWLVYLEGEG